MATLTTPVHQAIPAQPEPSDGEPAPVRRRSPSAVVVGNMLLLLGALALAFGGFLVGGSRLEQQHSQHLLYGQLRSTLKHSVTPVAEPIAAGTPIALLESPRLGGSQVVVEGSTSRDLMKGPGHRPDTPLPGQLGVSVLMGRALTYGGPFADLHLLRPGDLVAVTTGQGRFSYRIDSVRRSDDRFVPLAAAPARLSLLTSDGSWTPSRTWIASGVLVAGVAQPGASGAGPAPAEDQPLQGDSGAAVALLLWAQALLVVAVAAVWAWLRLPRVVVWVAVLPVATALLWNVFDNLSALLPNLL